MRLRVVFSPLFLLLFGSDISQSEFTELTFVSFFSLLFPPGAPNPFAHVKKTLGSSEYFSLPALNDPRVDRLPYSIRVLLESALRNCDEFQVLSKDVETILNWEQTSTQVRPHQLNPLFQT